MTAAGPVATRYANALFELARDKGVLDTVTRDVEFIGAELAIPEVSAHLFDARVPPEVKKKRLDALQPHLNALTHNFLQLLFDKRRLDALREIPAAFRARTLRESGAVEGWVETPRPIDAGEVASLESALGARLGKTVHLETRIVPELLAGARVFVDNKLIDMSAVGRLESLRSRLLEARLGTN